LEGFTVAYAIVQAGGKQFRVTEGQVVRVPSIAAEVGSTVKLETLVHGDGDRIEVGSPVIDGTTVTATVVEHGRGDKIIVFKKKRRKQYKKTHGHRQNYTAVRIESIGAASNDAAPADNVAPADAPSGEAASSDVEASPDTTE
jgi:large subunit ribosomal protein L21